MQTTSQIASAANWRARGGASAATTASTLNDAPDANRDGYFV